MVEVLRNYWYLALVIVPIAIYLQKNKLPSPVCKFVARYGFVPMLPLTIATQYVNGRWFDQIEQGVYLGAVPLVVGFNHVDSLAKQHGVKVRLIFPRATSPLFHTFPSLFYVIVTMVMS